MEFPCKFSLDPSTVEYISSTILKRDPEMNREKFLDFIKENYAIEGDPWSPMLSLPNTGISKELAELNYLQESLSYLLRPLAAVMEEVNYNKQSYPLHQSYELLTTIDAILSTSSQDQMVLLKCKSSIEEMTKELDFLQRSFTSVKRRNDDAFRIFNFVNSIMLEQRDALLKEVDGGGGGGSFSSPKAEIKTENYEEYLNVQLMEADDKNFDVKREEFDDIIDDDEEIDEDDDEDEDEDEEEDEEEEDENVKEKKPKKKRKRRRNPNNPFECNLCGKCYQIEASLQRHFESFHLNGIECHICNDICSSKSEFKDHFKEVHPGLHELQCPTCKKEYIKRISLRNHMNIAHSLNHKCEKCGEKFRTKRLLTAHNNNVHTDKEEEAHPCETCGKIFAKREYVQTHIKYVHERHTIELKAMCDLCGKKYEQNWMVIRHKKLTHEGQFPFKCKLCPKAFKKNHSLKLHVNVTHEGKKEYKCDKCGKDFSYINGLRTHVKAVHESGSFTCQYCGKTFTRYTVLTKHTKNLHLKPKIIVMKEFPCKHCTRSYGHKDNLRKHMKQFHPQFLD